MANTYDDGVLDYFVDLKRKRERNRVTMEWTDELTIRLILAVKNHEALWNTQIIEYRVKNLRETAWREISEKTFNGQVDITEISVKWTNLRIQFRSCFAKKKLEGIEDHFPKWKFYNHMKFIVDIEKKPSNASAITESLEHYIKTEPNRGYADETTPLNTPTSRRKRKPETPLNIQPPKKITSEPYLQEHKRVYETEDSFDTFGRFLASELRSIPNLTNAHKIQRKLQRLLIDCMDELDASGSVTSVTKPQVETSVQKTDKNDKIQMNGKSSILGECSNFSILGL